MIDDDINNIESELIKVCKAAGARGINIGDIISSTLSFPAVDIMLQDITQNDMQVMQAGQIGWNLTYQIHCLYSGSEQNKTFKNARRFVNNIYDKIQAEKTGDRLNNNAFDLECLSVEYGKTTLNIDSPTLVDGGKIIIIIQIFEQR